MGQGTTPGEGRQVQAAGPFTAANLVSLSRVPLAALFAASDRVAVRLPVLVAAAASDLLDGWLARRWGPSRLGAVLDPVTDKVFMATAFLMLLLSRALTPLEVLGVLLRDIVAPLGYLASVALGRPFAMPARVGGKAVTTLQSLTLFAWLLGSRYLEPLAWATAAVALYALADYGRLAVRRVDPKST
jgi:phosphatidylglycerophosphate synthase